MILQSLKTESSEDTRLVLDKCGQRVSDNGTIIVPKKAWIVRIVTLAGLLAVIAYTVHEGLRFTDPFLLYSVLMPLNTFLTLAIAWLFYKNPSSSNSGNELVSVIIPVYNQRNMIEFVIDAIYRSTYKNIEVVAVNDGSKDGTKEVLDMIAKKYPTLKVIHRKNEGKRKAVASGFYASKGKYVVLIDSDSVIDRNAITEIMKAFNSDPKTGAIVGFAKALNGRKSIITRCQDAWYDFSFNLIKGCESRFGCVTCCSGCMSAYRREAIDTFIPYWAEARIQNSTDRVLTSYVIAPSPAKTELRMVFGDKFWVPMSQRLMESMAQYDDSEDRGLTAHTIAEQKAKYVASAIVYTDVPDTWKGFFKQQLRWMKGYIRTNFFVNSFFWKKNPIVSLIYYTSFMTTFTSPFISFILLFYAPLVLQHFWFTLSVLAATFAIGFAEGLDYKFRDPNARHWMYRPLINMITFHVRSWLVFPALWTLRKNQWFTR